MTTLEQRKTLIGLISEAIAAGARQARARDAGAKRANGAALARQRA